MSAKPSLQPRRWTPPAPPSPVTPSPLPALEVLAVPGEGPEDVLVLPDGSVVTGLADGRVVRLQDGRVDVVADTGGRPLGIELLPGGRLLVCDARRGLLVVDPADGGVDVLAAGLGGAPMRFCNNAAVQADGTTWFSDSSQRFGIEHYRADLLEHSATGRLARRDPDGTVTVVRDGLSFTNGVACAPDGSWVVWAETGAYALTRLDPRTGEVRVLVDSLPGIPDNIALGSDGLIWVALPTARNPQLDALLPRAPWLRRLVWRLPERVQPAPGRVVWVQAYSVDGVLVHDLRGTHPDLHFVTGVRERDGVVWLGSLTGRHVGRFRVPGATA